MGVYGCSSVATSIFAFVRFGISTTKLSKVPSPSSPEEERNGMSCHGDIVLPVLSEKKIRYSRDSDCPSSLVENSLLLLLMLPPREAILLASVSSAEEEEEDFSLGDGQRHNDAKALFSLRK